jgi:phage terminase small subunit
MPRSVKAVLTKNGLDTREEAFCQHFIVYGIASKAAAAAGYAPTTNTTTQILSKPRVQARIRELQEEQREASLLTSKQLLEELANMITLDPHELLDENGRVRPLQDMPKAVRKSIRELSLDEIYERDEDGVRRLVGYNRKLKVYDKARSLELYMKHLGMLTERLEVSGKLSLEQLVNASLKDGGSSGKEGP